MDYLHFFKNCHQHCHNLISVINAIAISTAIIIIIHVFANISMKANETYCHNQQIRDHLNNFEFIGGKWILRDGKERCRPHLCPTNVSPAKHATKFSKDSFIINININKNVHRSPMYSQHSMQLNSRAICLHHHRSPMNQGSPMYQWYHQCITSIACNKIL